MLPPKEIQLFKKAFIGNELSLDNLIILKNCLFEFRDQESEDTLSIFIDEKIASLKSNILITQSREEDFL